MNRRIIILDTDMGSDVDDSLCLALALAAPDVELVALTHVTRDTQLRARISRRLLDLAGRADMAVYAGCQGPVAGEDRFVWFGNEGKGILDPDVPLDISAEPAVDALARLLHDHSGLEVVAVGPLTNIAMLLARHPDAAPRIARLTIMGGHIRRVAYGGHVFPPGVDYNLCSDPEASVAVLRAGIPTRLVTADVTLQVWLTQADVAQLEASRAPLHQALARAVRAWTPIMRRIFGGNGASIDDDNVAFLHDPLAFACAYDESFCTFEDLDIEPAIVDGVFRTLERDRASPATRRMRCATAVDATRFRTHFMERVLSLA